MYYDVCISIIIGCSLSVPAGWRSPIYDFIAVRAARRECDDQVREHESCVRPLSFLVSFSDLDVSGVATHARSLLILSASTYTIYKDRSYPTAIRRITLRRLSDRVSDRQTQFSFLWIIVKPFYYKYGKAVLL